jgi:alpha-mannosidase
MGQLKNFFYRPLGAAELTGFTTTEKLSAEQASQGQFEPRPVGSTWGEKFQYGWFRGQVTTPAEAAGTKFVLQHGLNGCEGLVFVNGQARGHLSKAVGQPFVLSLSAKKGESFDLLIEAYAGNHPQLCSGGPVPLDQRSVPDVHPANTPVIGETTFGIWQQEAYQLYMDVAALQSMLPHLQAESLRACEITQALKDFTLIVDFECSPEETFASFVAAREHLAPVMAKPNGPSAPTLMCLGHGHLDVAWLWPLAETERKVARTLSHQLSLIEEFPFHRFLHPQPHLHWMLKRDYPELYGRVKQAIADGEIVADGAVWIEPDTNMSSGESLIRQFLHGKRWYREEYGVDSEVLWLPDVFGYSASLPQIMRGCGVKYFSSWKIFWNYHGGEDFPHHIFTWEGIDGSSVLVELLDGYGMGCIPDSTIRNWKHRRTFDPRFDQRLHVYGYGDGGGGPALEHVEFMRRQVDMEGCPKMKPSSLAESFAELEAKGEPTARFVGEMYFQCHRGVLTSQAKTKLGNRRSEIALREAEMWSVAASTVGQDYVFPAEQMTDAWRTVLLNQFHDILPGSSIRRVHEEAEAQYAEVVASARDLVGHAAAALAEESGDALTVFNSLSWDHPVLVALPHDWPSATDADGAPLCVQKAGDQRLIEVDAPSCGWTTVTKHTEEPGNDINHSVEVVIEGDVHRLVNELICVSFDSAGRVTSVVDKTTGREFIDGLGNEFKMFKDVPSDFDAWDIDSMYEMQPVELANSAEIETLTAGPLLATLRVKRTVNNSALTQDITLRAGSRRVDFETVIDWQERHKLLKVGFDTNVHANEAIHEIQFGYLARPNHRSRQFDADRFEVANHRWTAFAEAKRGAAVLNDCKYAVNCLGGTINLTLLRAPMAPDDLADRGRQEFAYAFYVWDDSSLADSGVVREGYTLNVPPTVAVGAAREGRSMFAVDAETVVLDTAKLAEDGSGDVIVRLYESARTAASCTLSTTLPAKAAVETDMLENETGPLDLADGKVALTFRAFEVKTVRLKM